MYRYYSDTGHVRLIVRTKASSSHHLLDTQHLSEVTNDT